MEVLLAETLAAAERDEAIKYKRCRRVSIDTTMQPKAVAHPTDSKLLQRGDRSACPDGTQARGIHPVSTAGRISGL